MKSAIIDLLKRHLECAPVDPVPAPPDLVGWNFHDERAFWRFLCVRCAGRIMRRGCHLPSGSEPLWLDQVGFDDRQNSCCGCHQHFEAMK